MHYVLLSYNRVPLQCPTLRFNNINMFATSRTFFVLYRIEEPSIKGNVNFVKLIFSSSSPIQGALTILTLSSQKTNRILKYKSTLTEGRRITNEEEFAEALALGPCNCLTRKKGHPVEN